MAEVVITGVGVVSPLGVGREAFWSALAAGRSGIGPLAHFDASALPVRIGGEVRDFDPKQYVKPRKSLKVMCREIQMAFAAAELAWEDSGLVEASVDPERMGVVLGSDFIYGDLEDLVDAYRSCLPNGQFDFARWGSDALPAMYPLWMLKYLPNMAACHIGIAHDARGPTNTITLGDAAGLLAIVEAMHVIERGAADLLIVGGVGCRLHPASLVYRATDELSHRNDDPQRASRPFDAARDGMVNAEGAAMLILESRAHAQRRGAPARAQLVAGSSRFQPGLSNGSRAPGKAIAASLQAALHAAQLRPAELGCLTAHGVSTIERDRTEAAALESVVGQLPIVALKSYFGNTGAASGPLETVATLLAMEQKLVLPTLNYEQPDPHCPLSVVHGEPQPLAAPRAAVIGHNTMGQAAAIVLAGLD